MTTYQRQTFKRWYTSIHVLQRTSPSKRTQRGFSN